MGENTSGEEPGVVSHTGLSSGSPLSERFSGQPRTCCFLCSLLSDGEILFFDFNEEEIPLPPSFGEKSLAPLPWGWCSAQLLEENFTIQAIGPSLSWLWSSSYPPPYHVRVLNSVTQSWVIRQEKMVKMDC